MPSGRVALTRQPSPEAPANAQTSPIPTPLRADRGVGANVKFFVGIHIPAHASRFDRCMISVNRIRNRKSGFKVNDWIMDSGAFTEVTTHGCYRSDPDEYAWQVNRWKDNGAMLAAVAQDYMCEPFVLAKTGLTVKDHQRMTVERYLALRGLCPGVHVMPVLQGWMPSDYERHIDTYGDALQYGAWCGVGSVCKRQSDPEAIEEILIGIHQRRPDLQLHLFGVKLTALASDIVRTLAYSSDSMAWSWAARKGGRNANDPAEAEAYVERVASQVFQGALYIPGVTA